MRYLFLSGFLNHCNSAERIHNFEDLYKYGHVRQAKGGTSIQGLNLCSIPPLKQTNKQTTLLRSKFRIFLSPLCSTESFFVDTLSLASICTHVSIDTMESKSL